MNLSLGEHTVKKNMTVIRKVIYFNSELEINEINDTTAKHTSKSPFHRLSNDWGGWLWPSIEHISIHLFSNYQGAEIHHSSRTLSKFHRPFQIHQFTLKSRTGMVNFDNSMSALQNAILPHFTASRMTNLEHLQSAISLQKQW